MSRATTPLATALLALVVAASALLAPGAASAAASVQSASASKSSAAATYRADVLKVTNKKRVAHDLATLRTQACVQRFAQRQANRMARQQRLFHQDLGPVLDACGLSAVGENVAYGYSSGREVVRAWMRSAGHRANILDTGYRLLGTGATRRDGTWYAVQVFGTRS